MSVWFFHKKRWITLLKSLKRLLLSYLKFQNLLICNYFWFPKFELLVWCLRLHWKISSQVMCTGHFTGVFTCVCWILEQNPRLVVISQIVLVGQPIKTWFSISTDKLFSFGRWMWKPPFSVKLCTCIILHSEAVKNLNLNIAQLY